MAVDGGVLFIALIIRFLISFGVAWVAAEGGHAPVLWGALSFFLLGLWAFIVLLVWHVFTQD